MRSAAINLSLLAFVVALSSPWAYAQTPPDQDDWILDTRLRYEGASQGGLQDANALTARVRAGHETRAWRGWRALAEIEGVVQLSDDFNDSVNGRTAYALVADPEALELNRLQLAWSGAHGRGAVIGRQRITLGNARFVGNVGFRQNEQTFDAVRLSGRVVEHATLSYIYIDRVRRIFGDDSPQGEWDSDSHIVHADVDLPLGRVSAYGLALDFAGAPGQSSQTYGARWQKEWEIDGYRPRLALEAAMQREYGSNPGDLDLGYQAAELGVRHGAWNAALGGERLEGDDARGFSTPLATLHAFQGWADVFLTTPPDGVRDLYANVAYTTAPWPGEQPVTFTVAYHDFADDSGDVDFGDEWNASARMSLSPHLSLEAKAAAFEGQDPRFADRSKVWLALEYRL